MISKAPILLKNVELMVILDEQGLWFAVRASSRKPDVDANSPTVAGGVDASLLYGVAHDNSLQPRSHKHFCESTTITFLRILSGIGACPN